MFLNVVRQRNPELVDVGFRLLADGKIEPDTYVIDLDRVTLNARAIAGECYRLGLTPWFISKQYGRNRQVSRAISEFIPVATAVDYREAKVIHSAGIPLGNVGHLVQIPFGRLDEVISWRVENVTVSDWSNLEAVNAAAERLGCVQRVLLKIVAPPGVQYPGQPGGFALSDVSSVLGRARDLQNARIVGVTGFPCVLFDEVRQVPTLTPLVDDLSLAAEAFRRIGVEPLVSMPSMSSVSTAQMLAASGATHVEPGHALTGTTPEHATNFGLEEVPSTIYVSQVALGEPLSVFGGGFYPRGHSRNILVETASGVVAGQLGILTPGNIDYYRQFSVRDEDLGRVSLGDPAVMSFRAQMFVTRSRVAVVSGLSSGAPELVDVSDSFGMPLKGDV